MVIKESNRTIALEFFANAYGKEDDLAIVRGKKVDCSPRIPRTMSSDGLGVQQFTFQLSILCF